MTDSKSASPAVKSRSHGAALALTRPRPAAARTPLALPLRAQSDVISKIDEQLRAEMVEAQALVARWATEQKHHTDSTALAAQRLLEGDKENLEQLHEELEGVDTADEALQQRAGDQNASVEQLKSELERLTAQETKLPPEQRRLESALSQHRQVVVQREAGYEQTLASKARRRQIERPGRARHTAAHAHAHAHMRTPTRTHTRTRIAARHPLEPHIADGTRGLGPPQEGKLAELHKGGALYRSRLGLAFERLEDERLRLTFTNIDPSDAMRQFSFKVFVDAADK